MIGIEFDNSMIERANRALAGIPGATVKAMNASINKAIEGARTDASRKASQIYFAKVSEIRGSIQLKKSNTSTMQAMMRSTGKRRQISQYRLTPKSPEKGRESVQAAVKREGGMKDLPGAFIARSRSGGGYTAYIREGTGKYAIRSLTSPALPQLVNNPEVVEYVEEQSIERVAKALDNQILRLLGAFR